MKSLLESITYEGRGESILTHACILAIVAVSIWSVSTKMYVTVAMGSVWMTAFRMRRTTRAL